MTQQYMGQIPDPSKVSGPDLAARLNAFDNAHRTNQSGPTRPANILAGGIWTRVVGGVFDLMVFDGTQDRIVMRVDGNLAGIPNLEAARNNLGLKALATKDKAAIVNDTTGTLPVNRGGTGGTTSAEARLNLGGTDAGGVMFFARNSAPPGWLKANGATISRTLYADLFTAIGTTFGSGDGSTNFTLPDLRGEFLRGWAESRGVDVGREFGSAQGDAIRNITGMVSRTAGSGLVAPTGDGNNTQDGALYAGPSRGLGPTATASGVGGDIRIDASRVVPTASENRPRNVALLACIKY